MKTAICVLALILNLSWSNVFSQSASSKVDPKWESYYKQYDSGILTNHQASDFIDVMKATKFVPVSKRLDRNATLLENSLLSLPQDYLEQMGRDGYYYALTYKHNDYYLLYNRYYNPVSKEMWDRKAPYLIILMRLDDLVKFD